MFDSTLLALPMLSSTGQNQDLLEVMGLSGPSEPPPIWMLPCRVRSGASASTHSGMHGRLKSARSKQVHHVIHMHEPNMHLPAKAQATSAFALLSICVMMEFLSCFVSRRN